MSQRRNGLVNEIASPFGLAAISTLIFLAAWLLPPSVYTGIMQEPDLLFLDPATLLYFLLCAASFVVGAWVIRWLVPSEKPQAPLALHRQPSLTFFVLPLLTGIGVTVVSLVMLIRQVPLLFLLLASQRAGELKDIMATDVEGQFTFAPLFLTAVCWWCYGRYTEASITTRQRRLVRGLLWLAILSLAAFSTITVSRNLLMPAVCGLAILFIERRRLARGLTVSFVFRAGLIGVAAIAFIFLGIALLRDASGSDDQLRSVAGYTIASYNRLAAVVNGNLHYPYAGTGSYLSGLATHTRALPFAWISRPPAAIDIWASEFQAVSQAGLDGSLIWSGAFGYIFSDLGWFAVPVVAIFGAITGFAWVLFRRRNVLGLLLYPWAGFCILFWIGTNYLLDSPIEVIIITAVALALYERLCARRGTLPVPSLQSSAALAAPHPH